jgi:hypothetical protein
VRPPEMKDGCIQQSLLWMDVCVRALKSESGVQYGIWLTLLPREVATDSTHPMSQKSVLSY